MKGMSRSTGSAVWPRQLMTIAAIVGYRLLLCLGSLAALVGGGTAVAYFAHARGSDRPIMFWALLWFWVTMAVLCYEPDTWPSPHPVLYRLFAGFAVVAAIAFTWVLAAALEKQTLLDRGVVKTAVVGAEHPWQSLITGTTTYAYTLRDADGREISDDFAINGDRLVEGSQFTVLVDPQNQIRPSLDLHPSPRAERIVAGAGRVVAVISLAGLALTLPRPEFTPARP